MVDAEEEAYDPMNDPTRRAKSNDPGWKYGYWKEIGNRDLVICNLCKVELKGGVKRLKNHLAGGHSDEKMCVNTTTAIRKKMGEYLEKKKRTRPTFLVDDDATDLQVIKEAPESSQAVKSSSGTAAKGRILATDLREEKYSCKERGGWVMGRWVLPKEL